MTDSRLPDLTPPSDPREIVSFYDKNSKNSPHVAALGMTVTSVNPGVVEMETPFDQKVVGNPETGVVHGGVITSILDHNSGMAIASLIQGVVPMATLDLRIDYMKPSAPDRTIRSRAHCYKTTKNIAFVRAVAYHDDIDDPIATSVCTFILSRPPGAEEAGHA